MKEQKNQGDDCDGKAPTRRPHDHATFEEIKENGLSHRWAGKVAVRKGQNHWERVIPVMLQTSGIGIREIIELGVVVIHIPDKGKVSALVSGGLEHGEIRVVRQLLIGLVENRTGGRARSML